LPELLRAFIVKNKVRDEINAFKMVVFEFHFEKASGCFALVICRKLDYKVEVIGLHLCLVSRFVSRNLAAFFAAVNDHVALFRVDLHADGLKCAAALRGAIAGVDVQMERPKAEGAVVARAVAQRLDLLAAMRAKEARIVFGEPFLFHKTPQNFKYRKG
jgi:hypothetical protein